MAETRWDVQISNQTMSLIGFISLMLGEEGTYFVPVQEGVPHARISWEWPANGCVRLVFSPTPSVEIESPDGSCSRENYRAFSKAQYAIIGYCHYHKYGVTYD